MLLNSVFNRAIHLGVIPLMAAVGMAIAPLPALANCNDVIPPLESVQPEMERLWQNLRSRDRFPWGTIQPYGSLSGNRITLTPEFELLSGTEKQWAIAILFNPDWLNLTHEEWIQIRDNLFNRLPGGGSPYEIYASDGRLVSQAYDACTRHTLLTERSRYSWYFNQMSRNPRITTQGLRNTGTPPWRFIQVPISEQAERSVRMAFWQTVGFSSTTADWWIAWVPEQGHFEINIATPTDLARLEPFWQVAPRHFSYVVVMNDGTRMREIRNTASSTESITIPNLRRMFAWLLVSLSSA